MPNVIMGPIVAMLKQSVATARKGGLVKPARAGVSPLPIRVMIVLPSQGRHLYSLPTHLSGVGMYICFYFKHCFPTHEVTGEKSEVSRMTIFRWVTLVFNYSERKFWALKLVKDALNINKGFLIIGSGEKWQKMTAEIGNLTQNTENVEKYEEHEKEDNTK